jgi:TolA-binding protein
MKRTANRILLLLTLGLTLNASIACADDIFLRSGKAAEELELKNITVRSVKNGELYYSINTREAHRPLAEISRLNLTGETQFNAAEKAFSEANISKDEAAAKAKFSDAVTGYAATLGSTDKPWLKDYVALRLQVAAPRSGRFDAALSAWKAMVEKDPAAALKSKPSVEGIDPKSQYLVNAAKDLLASANSAANPEVRKAYLDLLGDVQSAMGDTEGAIKTAEMRVALGGTPEEISALAMKQAQNDLVNKRYDQAAARLSKLDMASLSDANRADATYMLAECKAAKLTPASPADEWKDLAIEYMKVVAGYPASPDAGPALLKVAEIHETLKDPETALKVYQQVAREHANTPAGQAAQKGVERLGKTAAAGN